MNKQNGAFIVVIILFIIIAVVIVSWYNYRLKKRIVDSGPIDEGAINFLRKLTDMGTEQLKWGCVLFSGGLGLVVIQFLPYYNDSPILWGLELMFVAAGFLLYYFIIRKQQRS
jgi:peptidoglycan/LPS O-acetylase OafA/YrhL